ncbi:MAG: 4-hydroxy-tetrahydrodipicolinate reductase, partial [Confluentibacter sp.]|nr:4-hydroxy-tetrahydrodipicolinate reductase [Confluentibacter sp.]
MKVALIGYGKMGKTIEKIAIERGHEIVAKLEETPNEENLNGADVAIEFTFPKSAYNNLKTCIDLQLPVVSGTTGWTEKL